MYQRKHSHILVHLRTDKNIVKVCNDILKERPYVFPTFSKNIYEDLIEAIVYQQVSIKAAKTVFARLKAGLGDIIPPPSELEHVSTDALRSFGLSRQKAAYVVNIAHFFRENELDNAAFLDMPDPEIIDLLTRIKGVGVWTVQMILMTSLGRPDVFPKLDLGIQQAMKELYGIELQKRELFLKMDEIAEQWRPYRTYACFLLWRWKRIQMGIDY